jgi:hypothetical protein
MVLTATQHRSHGPAVQPLSSMAGLTTNMAIPALDTEAPTPADSRWLPLVVLFLSHRLTALIFKEFGGVYLAVLRGHGVPFVMA